MLNKLAFANSLALVVIGFYVVLYFIASFAPTLFSLFFNAQFFGADIASLIPEDFSLFNFAGTLISITIMSWVMGYFWAWFYNKLAK
jgi:hypothetical protein